MLVSTQTARARVVGIHHTMNASRPTPLAQALLVALLLWPVAIRAEGKLKVQFLDVGQGDATLITCPHGTHHLLIDSGDNKYPHSQENFQRDLKAALGGTGQKLEVAIASHPHSDHIGGMEWVLTNYHVATYIDNGQPAETATWSHINTVRMKRVKSGALNYIDGKKSNLLKFKLCSAVSFTLITPAAQAKLSDTNDRSVGVRVESLGKSFLFVGDMEKAAEDAWLNKLGPDALKLARADVLKVGHHGSDTSSTEAFIHQVQPGYAFVMCGARGVSTNVGYKHPRASTLRAYANWLDAKGDVPGEKTDDVWAYNKGTENWITVPRPKRFWLTVADGIVTLETDGQTINVTTEK